MKEKTLILNTYSMKELKEKRYIFLFTPDGWNTVVSKTKRGAIAKAKKEFPGLVVNEQSFVVASAKTEAFEQSLLSLFY